MKRTRHTTEQIIEKLRDAPFGLPGLGRDQGGLPVTHASMRV